MEIVLMCRPGGVDRKRTCESDRKALARGGTRVDVLYGLSIKGSEVRLAATAVELPFEPVDDPFDPISHRPKGAGRAGALVADGPLGRRATDGDPTAGGGRGGLAAAVVPEA